MTILADIATYVPDWVFGILLLGVAAGVAMLVYALFTRALLRVMQAKASIFLPHFERVRRPVRAAVVLLAASFAAQLPFFTPRVSDAISKFLSVSAVVLIGWGVIVAIDIASSLYLRRFQLDAPDNLLARKHFTQIRVLKRAIDVMVGLFTVAAALMLFEPIRQFGFTLFASAGAAGLIVGLAARPLLSNLIAGIQLAVTQPIRMDDVVIVEGEWGIIEEITSTYVVIKIWDWRRLIVPLAYFMEKPFQNWTRNTAEVIGSVFMRTDYAVPVEDMRARLNAVVKESKLWDGKVVNLQVTDLKDEAVELRMLVSARTASEAWDLRCEVREKMLAYLQTQWPDSLPRRRVDVVSLPQSQPCPAPP